MLWDFHFFQLRHTRRMVGWLLLQLSAADRCWDHWNQQVMFELTLPRRNATPRSAIPGSIPACSISWKGQPSRFKCENYHDQLSLNNKNQTLRFVMAITNRNIQQLCWHSIKKNIPVGLHRPTGWIKLMAVVPVCKDWGKPTSAAKQTECAALDCVHVRIPWESCAWPSGSVTLQEDHDQHARQWWGQPNNTPIWFGVIFESTNIWRGSNGFLLSTAGLLTIQTLVRVGDIGRWLL